MDIEAFEEKTLTRKEIFNGRMIQVVVDEVLLPNGQTSTRELVFHPGAVAIIPITDQNKLIMVKQYRKPIEKVLLEIPAGKIDPDEVNHPQETAARELEEETGYRANSLTLVTSMYVSPGFANELLHIYFAQDLRKVSDPRPMDDDEILELYQLTLNEAKEAIANGCIRDAKTIVAIQYWELQQLQQQLKEERQ